MVTCTSCNGDTESQAIFYPNTIADMPIVDIFNLRPCESVKHLRVEDRFGNFIELKLNDAGSGNGVLYSSNTTFKEVHDRATTLPVSVARSNCSSVHSMSVTKLGKKDELHEFTLPLSMVDMRVIDIFNHRPCKSVRNVRVKDRDGNLIEFKVTGRCGGVFFYSSDTTFKALLEGGKRFPLNVSLHGCSVVDYVTVTSIGKGFADESTSFVQKLKTYKLCEVEKDNTVRIPTDAKELRASVLYKVRVFPPTEQQRSIPCTVDLRFTSGKTMPLYTESRDGTIVNSLLGTVYGDVAKRIEELGKPVHGIEISRVVGDLIVSFPDPVKLQQVVVEFSEWIVYDIKPSGIVRVGDEDDTQIQDETPSPSNNVLVETYRNPVLSTHTVDTLITAFENASVKVYQISDPNTTVTITPLDDFLERNKTDGGVWRWLTGTGKTTVPEILAAWGDTSKRVIFRDATDKYAFDFRPYDVNGLTMKYNH